MADLGGFRWANGGRHNENLNRLLPRSCALAMINRRGRDPPRTGPAARLASALQCLGAAVNNDCTDRLLQHLGNLVGRVSADVKGQGVLLSSHDSSYRAAVDRKGSPHRFPSRFFAPQERKRSECSLGVPVMP